MSGTLDIAGFLDGNKKITKPVKDMFVKRTKEIITTGQITIARGDFLPDGKINIITSGSFGGISGSIYAGAKEKNIITFKEKFPNSFFAKNISDDNKFRSYYEIWIDGYCTAILNSLNFQSNYSIPFFDTSKLTEDFAKAPGPAAWQAPPALVSPIPLSLLPPPPAPSAAALFYLSVPPLSPTPADPDPTKYLVRYNYALSLVKPVLNTPVFSVPEPIVKYSQANFYMLKLMPIVIAGYAKIYAQTLASAPTFTPEGLFQLNYRDIIDPIIGLWDSPLATNSQKDGMAAAAALATIVAEASAISALGTTIGAKDLIRATAIYRGY